MRTILGCLEELSDVFIKCREIPKDFFDVYGREVDGDMRDYERTFYTVNPKGPETPCGREWAADKYKVLAIVLKRKHDYKRNSRYDTRPVFMSAYFYSRMDVGCRGETITRATCSSISGIAEMLDGLGRETELLGIGRNEYFKPTISPEEKKKGTIIIEKSNERVKITPLLPQEDAVELLNRFSILLQRHNSQ